MSGHGSGELRFVRPQRRRKVCSCFFQQCNPRPTRVHGPVRLLLLRRRLPRQVRGREGGASGRCAARLNISLSLPHREITNGIKDVITEARTLVREAHAFAKEKAPVVEQAMTRTAAKAGDAMSAVSAKAGVAADAVAKEAGPTGASLSRAPALSLLPLSLARPCLIRFHTARVFQPRPPRPRLASWWTRRMRTRLTRPARPRWARRPPHSSLVRRRAACRRG